MNVQFNLKKAREQELGSQGRVLEAYNIGTKGIYSKQGCLILSIL